MSLVHLPTEFIDRMQSMLGQEADAFLQSYKELRTQGLRLNPLKLCAGHAHFQKLAAAFQLDPVSWCPTGFYYEETTRPGKHPWHAAGLYYIQEPSAMSAVELLQPQPGDIVLDLAAAPGGKSTQIAGKLRGQGLLIANEIHAGRAKILAENIERSGIANAVVLNAAPDQLSQRFPVYFDKIMFDAPCSGEGMFRKDPDAVGEWSVNHVRMCAARQLDILLEAVKLLKPGGRLTYSTCTFNEEENELTIAELQKQLSGQFKLIAMERIWPHRHKGEGHFAAVLEKHGSEGDRERDQDMDMEKNRYQTRSPAKGEKANKALSGALALFEAFRSETLAGFTLGPGEPLLFGDQLYWLPHAEGCSFGSVILHGLRSPRPGLHLGELKKKRFEPAHALALALPNVEKYASLFYELTADSPQAYAYLRGEALTTDRSVNGWTVVSVDGFPLGWGKESSGQLKNHYPKGLRQPH